MDINFEINNIKGDQILVALSLYDTEIIYAVTQRADAMMLDFYDVTLVRKRGSGNVGIRTLNTISGILARFLIENPDSVLSFVCDRDTDTDRSHISLSPQEFRSQLFTRMFQLYESRYGNGEFENIKIQVGEGKECNIAHFICHTSHTDTIAEIGTILKVK